MAKFFINTGDGIEFRDTRDEARKLANESLDFWRKDARNSGEWSDEVRDVYWGRVMETAKFKPLDEDAGDYVLEPIPIMPVQPPPLSEGEVAELEAAE